MDGVEYCVTNGYRYACYYAINSLYTAVYGGNSRR